MIAFGAANDPVLMLALLVPNSSGESKASPATPSSPTRPSTSTPSTGRITPPEPTADDYRRAIDGHLELARQWTPVERNRAWTHHANARACRDRGERLEHRQNRTTTTGLRWAA